MKGTNYRASKIGTQAAFHAFSASNIKYRAGDQSEDFILNDEDIRSAEEKLKKT